MKPNEFLTHIESYWKEKLTPDNRRIYRDEISGFKPDDLQRIALTVVRSCVFFPKVRDILKVAREDLKIEEEPEVKKTDCPICSGTKWRYVECTDPLTGRPYDAVTTCACIAREPAPSRPD